MSGDDALPVDHVGPAGPAQVDAADDVIEGVILIDAHQIEDGLPVLLYGHPHLDAQLAFINRIGVGGQVVGLLEQRQKIPLQPLRRASVPLHQLSLQIVQGNGIQLIDLRRLLQHRFAVFLRSGQIRDGFRSLLRGGFLQGGGFLRKDFPSLLPFAREGLPGFLRKDLFRLLRKVGLNFLRYGKDRFHAVVSGNGHHAVRQHMDVGLHGLGGLPGHRLQAVQQNIISERLHGKGHDDAAHDH